MLLLPVLLFSACREAEKPLIKKERFPDAGVYNDFIINLYDSLAFYQEQVAVAFENPDQRVVARNIKLFRLKCIIFADSINALPDWKGDTSLRFAAVNLFRVYETEAARQINLIPILYRPDVVDTNKVTDTVGIYDTLDPNDLFIPRYQQLIRKLEKNETEALELFMTAQAAFAERNKVKLVRKRLSDDLE